MANYRHFKLGSRNATYGGPLGKPYPNDEPPTGDGNIYAMDPDDRMNPYPGYQERYEESEGEYEIRPATSDRAGYTAGDTRRPEGHYMGEPYEGPDDGRAELSPVDTDALLSVTQRELDSSLGWTGTRLAEARRTNLNTYLGNSRGDEREGRSQVITREVFEVVEWAMPPVMEAFTSSHILCEATPVGKEDVEGAKQATDACNWAFRKNRGFEVLDMAVRDAFISKNGIVRVYWDDSVETEYERYLGKNLIEMDMLEADPNFDVHAVTVKLRTPEGPQEIPPDAMEQFPPEALEFDVEGMRTNSTGGIRLQNIPPEEFIINRDARGLHDPTCRFVGHRVRSSESELIAQGYDPDLVRSLPGSQSVYTTDQDWIIRASQDDGQPLVHSYRSDSERTIHVNDCFIRVDLNNDGISEWWNVIVAGEYGQVLLSATPSAGHEYASGTPIQIPHRFFGLALADIAKDLQHTSTSFRRNYLDARYLDTDPRYQVLSRGDMESSTPMVNLNQLVDSSVGNYIEVFQEGALQPLVHGDNSQTLIPAMEAVDKWVMYRTGVSPESMGVNAESISKHVYGAMVQATASQQRIMYYARNLAEQLIKDIFRLIFRAYCQHAVEPFELRLQGEWVPIDPRTWNTNLDMEISLSLGAGSKMEKVSNATSLMEVQRALRENGMAHLVGDEQIFNSVAYMTESMGFKDVERFVRDPNSPEAQQAAQMMAQQQDPAEQALLLEQQAKNIELQLDADERRLDWVKEKNRHEEKMLELKLKDAENEAKFGVEEQRVEIEKKSREEVSEAA